MRMNNWTVCVQDRGNGEMSLRRLKFSTYEVVKPREEEEGHSAINTTNIRACPLPTRSCLNYGKRAGVGGSGLSMMAANDHVPRQAEHVNMHYNAI
jgi:hypothetical protein